MKLLKIYNIWETDCPMTKCVEVDQVVSGDNRISRDFYILVEGDSFGLSPLIREELKNNPLPIKSWESCPVNFPEDELSSESKEE